MIPECNLPLRMPTEDPQPQSTRQSPRRDHERTDASTGWIFGIVSLLAFVGVLIHVVLAGMLTSLKREPPPTDLWKPVHPSAVAADGRTNFPRLQISPPADLQSFRAREQAELNSYWWLDKQAGIVRIPVARAMDLLLEKGLPAQTGTNQNKAGPSSYQLQQQRSLRK